jgi:hypothetical protein
LTVIGFSVVHDIWITDIWFNMAQWSSPGRCAVYASSGATTWKFVALTAFLASAHAAGVMLLVRGFGSLRT